MNIEKVFVVGAGFMGSGIVENAAAKGLKVTVYDIAQSQLDKSIASITKAIIQSTVILFLLIFFSINKYAPFSILLILYNNYIFYVVKNQ